MNTTSQNYSPDTPQRPSTLAALWAIVKLKVRRKINQVAANLRNSFSTSRSESDRTGTGRSGTGLGCLAVLGLFLLMAVPFWFQMPLRIYEKVEQKIARQPELTVNHWLETPPAELSVEHSEWQKKSRERRRKLLVNEWINPQLTLRKFWLYETYVSSTALKSPEFLGGVSTILTIMALAILLAMNGINPQATGQLDFNVQQMMRFPLTPVEVYASTIIERALTSLFGWILFVLGYSAVLLLWNWSYLAFVLAFPLALLTNLLVATASVFLEIFWLRTFSGYRLRTLRALCSVFGLLIIFGVFLLDHPGSGVSDYGLELLQKVAPLGSWLPIGRALRLFQPTGFTTVNLAVFAGELIGFIFLLGAGINRLGNRSLEAIKGARSGANRSTPTTVKSSSDFWSGILGKDLRLLFRSKNLLVQVAVLPLLFLGFQLLVNQQFLTEALAAPAHWTAVAFGLGLYTLMMAAPNILYHEKEGLWLLYTFARKLHLVFLRKIGLWVGLGLCYGLLTWLAGLLYRGRLVARDLSGLIWILLGLPVFGVIAGSIGVLTTDPQAQNTTNKTSIDVVYFIMFLGSGLLGGLYFESYWQQLTVLILYGALALALYQKLQLKVRHLLDPAAFQDRAADLADGIVTALVFFFFQHLLGLILYFTGLNPGLRLVLSFTGAGFIALLLVGTVLYVRGVDFWSNIKLKRVPSSRLLKDHLLVTTPVAVCGLLFLLGLSYWFAAPEPTRELKPLLILVLTVVAAPLYEEIIFRGLIFHGIRNTLNLFPAAVFSGLIFAFMHPPTATVPVFLLGLCAAYLYEKHENILSPMVLHATYNLCVIGFQLYFLNELKIF